MKQLATKEDFDAELKAAGSQLVVVDFFATWCGPCVHFAPKFAELSEKYKDCVFVKVDVDENDKTAQDQKISAMPTFKLYKNGSEVGELVGASEVKLVELIEKHRS